MSGVSLATFPAIRPDPEVRNPGQTRTLGNVVGSLRVIELQLVGFIMVFAASGVVPVVDLLFPVVSTAYFLFLSRLVFPSRRRFTPGSQAVFRENVIFRFYVAVGTVVGLFLPLAFVFGGFARGDGGAVRSATPHLFLLSFQILTENVLNGFELMSPPVRALVPLLYTTRRIFVIVDWIFDVWVDKILPPWIRDRTILGFTGRVAHILVPLRMKGLRVCAFPIIRGKMNIPKLVNQSVPDLEQNPSRLPRGKTMRRHVSGIGWTFTCQVDSSRSTS